MDSLVLWFLMIGLLFILMVAAGSLLKRLPLSSSILYLAFGLALGPYGLKLIDLHVLEDSVLLERLSELAVIISLFTAGLKLRLPFRDPQWRVPLQLATLAMLITVGLITGLAHFAWGLPLGVALILGAILAPTDPVLASDVQVERPGDRDRLRFALTGEAGLNDGSAFPFLLLGLGLLGLHDIGSHGGRWWLHDVLWATVVGLGLGFALGAAVGRFVLYLRRQHKEAVGLDDFLALGLIALSYGGALALEAYGFLAVFAAGLALRQIEHGAMGEKPMSDEDLLGPTEVLATDPSKAPAFMTQAVLRFNEQLERLGEIVVVVLIGTLLSPTFFKMEALIGTALLFFIIRPVAVRIGLLGTHDISPLRRRLISWFGIRGLGSIYYLCFALNHGIPAPYGEVLLNLTLHVIFCSALLHGVSVTPLMRFYEGRMQRIQVQKEQRLQPRPQSEPLR